MSMDYIRRAYNVPAKRGGRIRFRARFADKSRSEAIKTIPQRIKEAQL